MKRSIYVASSWRNYAQPFVVRLLRDAGHEVYDFRNPAPGNAGFSWKQCGPAGEGDKWTPQRLADVLRHPVARAGFLLDFEAMQRADTCVLLLPCGRSAHLEAGWMRGAGKRVFVLAPEVPEPELMYLCFDTVPLSLTPGDLLDRLSD